MSLRKAKLYKKILLSFLAVLVVTLTLIMALFTHTVGREFSQALVSYTVAKTTVARDLIQSHLDRVGPAEVEATLKPLTDQLAKSYRAKVWLEEDRGPSPAAPENKEHKRLIRRLAKQPVKNVDGVKVWCSLKRGWDSMTAVPIKLPGGKTGTLRILFFHHGPSHPGPGFALGLVAVGVLVALMVYPVSRIISRPINQLQQSALRIAGGDLDHRAPVGKRLDEIGQLSRAFNHMADRLQQMIHSGRELTANVSHELRSPLARIRVAEELVRDGLNQADRQRLGRHLDRIRTEIEDLDGLIGQILALSKLDLGREEFKLGPVDLERLTAELQDRFRPLARSRNLNLTAELEPGLIVSADEEALRSALGNLIDNAVKYCPQGGRVAIRAFSRDGRAEWSIVNPARPLSPADLKAVFEPFHTVPAPETENQTRGTGLGLAMVQRIITRLEGTIEAANTAEGLRLRVSLPLTGAKG